MWRSFYCSSNWALWAWLGIPIIGAGTWAQVQLEVQINAWVGDFYDLLQKALGKDGVVSEHALYETIFQFAKIAVVTSWSPCS